jgi:hypothetical protein
MLNPALSGIQQCGGTIHLVSPIDLHRGFWRLFRRVLLCAAGSGVLAGQVSCNGKIIPQHPSIRLTSSSITPAGTIHVGQKIHAIARTNIPTSAAQPVITQECKPELQQLLYDDGTHGDKVAHDGEWALDYTWTEADGTGPGSKLFVILTFPSMYDIQVGASVKLNVQPEPEATERNASHGSPPLKR